MKKLPLCFCLLIPLLSCSQPVGEFAEGSQAKAEAAAAHDARMEWWRDSRFGLFIHWGLYAVPAGEWDGKTNYAEWIQHSAHIPVPTYEKFVDEFNPVEFNADAWVLAAKAAGMKYIVITSKHHDGFALYDSQISDYDVMNTPFKRDIMKELSEACARHDMKMCWYHSIMDWHHDDYLPRRGWEKADRPVAEADMDRYVDYLSAQVTELLTNYGPIGVMWFDGEWEGTWNHDYGQELYDLCRELQPDVIVNNRVDKGRGGMAGMTAGPDFAGDFGTPEQEIPATGLPGTDWETCMTMNRHWGFNARDLDFKSSTDLIQKLCDIASKGGNFLLNVGPTAAGTFPQESLDRLSDMGEWMDVNGDAIYGTEASPFPSLPWGRCTMKREGEITKLYFHVFDWPTDKRLAIPGLGSPIIGARLLSDPARKLSATGIDSDVLIHMLPKKAPDAHASVIELTISGEPVVYLPPQISAVSEKFVNEMEVVLEVASSGLKIRYTLDGSMPSKNSPIYSTPLKLTQSAVIRAQSFHLGAGVSSVTQKRFTRVTPSPAVKVTDLAPGLKLEVYQGDWDTIPDFDGMTAVKTSVASAIKLPKGPSTEREGRLFQGYVNVPTTGLFRFALSSDDGSRLWLDGKLLIDLDGLHGSLTKEGVAALAAGPHAIRVEWFNKTGGGELSLKMAEPNEDWAIASSFFRPKN